MFMPQTRGIVPYLEQEILVLIYTIALTDHWGLCAMIFPHCTLKLKHLLNTKETIANNPKWSVYANAWVKCFLWEHGHKDLFFFQCEDFLSQRPLKFTWYKYSEKQKTRLVIAPSFHPTCCVPSWRGHGDWWGKVVH